MNNPVANCFRFAKIEHGGMVAPGPKLGSGAIIPKRILTPERLLELRVVLKHLHAAGLTRKKQNQRSSTLHFHRGAPIGLAC